MNVGTGSGLKVKPTTTVTTLGPVTTITPKVFGDGHYVANDRFEILQEGSQGRVQTLDSGPVSHTGSAN